MSQHLLSCNNHAHCDVVTLNAAYRHAPFTARVETMMRSIADKIANRAAIPNNSAEVGFVNQTTEPVYKMLSIVATIPGSGLSDTLIGQYRDVIAADYAFLFLPVLKSTRRPNLAARKRSPRRRSPPPSSALAAESRPRLHRHAERWQIVSQDSQRIFELKSRLAPRHRR